MSRQARRPWLLMALRGVAAASLVSGCGMVGYTTKDKQAKSQRRWVDEKHGTLVKSGIRIVAAPGLPSPPFSPLSESVAKRAAQDGKVIAHLQQHLSAPMYEEAVFSGKKKRMGRLVPHISKDDFENSALCTAMGSGIGLLGGPAGAVVGAAVGAGIAATFLGPKIAYENVLKGRTVKTVEIRQRPKRAGKGEFDRDWRDVPVEVAINGVAQARQTTDAKGLVTVDLREWLGELEP